MNGGVHPRVPGLEIDGPLGVPGWLRAREAGRPVAIRPLEPDLERALARAAALTHPALAIPRAARDEAGRPVAVVEQPAGAPLDLAALDARGRAALIARLARALEHAHDRAVVHGGLGPERVLVAGGEPRLFDTGLLPAAATARPEDDVRALGRLLEGEPALARAAGLCAAPGGFATARELALDLEAWLAGRPPPPRQAAGARLVVVLLVILATLVGGGMAILSGFHGEASRQPREPKKK